MKWQEIMGSSGWWLLLIIAWLVEIGLPVSVIAGLFLLFVAIP